MGKRATQAKKRANARREAEFDALQAENLRLREELERSRLRHAGAHPGAGFIDAMKVVDQAGDAADEAVTMYTSSMMIRAELQGLLGLLQRTIAEFEQRLDRLDHRAEFPLEALEWLLEGSDSLPIAINGTAIGDNDVTANDREHEDPGELDDESVTIDRRDGEANDREHDDPGELDSESVTIDRRDGEADDEWIDETSEAATTTGG